MKSELKAGNLRLKINETGFELLNAEGDQLLESQEARLFFSRFNQSDNKAGAVTSRAAEEGMTICYAFEPDAPLKWAKTFLQEKGRYLLAYSQFEARVDVCLNEMELFPKNTKAPLYKAVNFRNHHCTELTYPDLAMGATFSTTTYSTDWQFAPHPTMMLFSKRDYHFFVGALDLPRSFGLYLDVEGYYMNRFAESYGDGEYGLGIKAGEVFTSTRYALFVDYKKDPHDVVRHYTDLLVQEGFIPNPALKRRFPWHRDNLYCTWIDQGYLTDTVIPTALHEQIEITINAANAVTDEMVRRAVSIIKREHLNFRTILIDMGWSERGEWLPGADRFPDFRGLVDWLHEEGFKVVVWWNWAEVANHVEINPKYFMENGRLNKHGQRMLDFSSPVTREEYFKPLFYRFFSNDPGCYDVDGVKTDFLSDKIHPDMQLYDDSWRGEEQYFYNVFRLFMTEMRKYKADAIHIGCAGHPYLAEFIDINRTYDVWSSNVLEHVNRGKMLEACTPGTTVAYDFHHFSENLEAYFKQAYEHDCSVQIGNIMGIKQHPVSGWSAAGAPYYDCLRLHLSRLPR